MDESKPKRRWQWTIRGLLMLTTAVAVLLAFYFNHDRRPSARAVATFRQLGAHVIYDYQQQGETWFVKASRWFGEDYFGSVVSVRMDGGQLSQEQLAMLAKLPRLRQLLLAQVDFTGKNWESLSQLQRLETLHLWGCAFGDEDIEVLQSISGLRHVVLNESMITDQGLEQLASFHSLETLALLHTMITPNGLATIRAALPKCHIQDVGRPAALAAILKMPDGKKTNQYEGGFEVKLSRKGRSTTTSSTNLHPGHLWIMTLPEGTEPITLTVTLNDRYAGSAEVGVKDGVAQPRYVEVLMKDMTIKTP